jgi:single-strand DNA-binding protein
MPSYNHITVIGHLGQDPDLRFTSQGTPVCSFTMAVNNRKKIDGEWNDVPIWFKVKVWGKQAESVSQYLSKGRAALVAGQLELENWTNRDGKDVTTLVINSNEVKFLGDGGGGERSERPQNTFSGQRPRASTAAPPAEAQPDISDDDIPF